MLSWNGRNIAASATLPMKLWTGRPRLSAPVQPSRRPWTILDIGTTHGEIDYLELEAELSTRPWHVGFTPPTADVSV